MIDTHAHIDGEAFEDDFEQIITSAQMDGVQKIVIPGIEPKRFERILSLCKTHDMLFCGLGIHPHNASDVTKEILEYISDESKANSNVVAIGECGLDYFYDFHPRDIQIESFSSQLKIAKENKLPVIVHNREADEDILDVITKEQDGNLSGVFHCFSSSLETMEKALDLNFHISFTGNITFKKTDLSEQVKKVPLNRLLLETDSPYMTPVPHRGKRNEPKFVRKIAEKIAEIKSIDINEVIDMTTQNALRLFRLSILFLICISSFSLLKAQPEDTTLTVYHPYEKGLGIGPSLGANTIVQTIYYKNGTSRVASQEGIFMYGGALSYSIFDFLQIETSYNYSLNNKVVEKNNNNIGPHVHRFFEINTQWIVNPYSRIMFFGSAGMSYILNTFDRGRTFEQKNNYFGFNGGIGFKINIPIKGFGLIVPFAEWRIDWGPNKTLGHLFEDNQIIEIESRSFYSTPRFGIMIYPKIFIF